MAEDVGNTPGTESETPNCVKEVLPDGTRVLHCSFATSTPNDYPEPEHKGNTIGGVFPKTSPMPSAPNKAPETPEEKNFLEWYASDYLDSVRQGLDDWVASTGYSQPAMVTGAILTGITKMVGAVMPTSGEEVVMMPLGVEVKGAGKALKWFEDAVKFKKEEEKARKAAEEAARLKKAEKEAQAAKDKKGGNIEGPKKAPEAKPKCFGGKQAAKNPAEYDRQLGLQEKALNNMSVQEYLDNRARWAAMKRAGTAAEQAAARADAIADMAAKETDKLLKTGMGAAEAEAKGLATAQSQAKGMDVLHSPDLGAGGSSSGTSGLGPSGPNRSIGSNWGQNQVDSPLGDRVGERVRDMDVSATKVPPTEQASTNMNVKLERCK